MLENAGFGKTGLWVEGVMLSDYSAPLESLRR